MTVLFFVGLLFSLYAIADNIQQKLAYSCEGSPHLSPRKDSTRLNIIEDHGVAYTLYIHGSIRRKVGGALAYRQILKSELEDAKFIRRLRAVNIDLSKVEQGKLYIFDDQGEGASPFRVAAFFAKDGTWLNGAILSQKGDMPCPVELSKKHQ